VYFFGYHFHRLVHYLCNTLKHGIFFIMDWFMCCIDWALKLPSKCAEILEVIKKFSAWPSSVQNKIKIVFASYSSKAQNTTCTIWLLGYKYFVHFSIWTKCLSDVVENANTRTAHKFLKNFLNDTDVTLQKFILHLVIQDETCIHNFNSESEQQSMQGNERIGQNCRLITLHNSVFSMSNANNRRRLISN